MPFFSICFLSVDLSDAATKFKSQGFLTQNEKTKSLYCRRVTFLKSCRAFPNCTFRCIAHLHSIRTSSNYYNRIFISAAVLSKNEFFDSSLFDEGNANFRLAQKPRRVLINRNHEHQTDSNLRERGGERERKKSWKVQ